ncbi:MAG: 3-isopropylmalate dehydratase small subunit [Pseudomonadota bacterium]
MQPFKTLKGVAAPFPLVNVDTDKIIPAHWLKTIHRTGLGIGLFEDMRFDSSGSEKPDFVLNQDRYRHAEILIAGENFGCGSSREHAPWALLDYGIRCVIAPSFADIFFNNCFKNGILPVVLPQEEINLLLHEAENAKEPVFTVDLEHQEVIRPEGNAPMRFNIDPFRKHCLFNGLDDIGLTLEKAPSIDKHENGLRGSQPWLFRDVA